MTLNGSSKFTVFIIVAFATKENSYISREDKAASRVNTQPSSKYFSVRTRFILFLCFVYMLSYLEIISYALSSMNMMNTSNFEYE